MSRKVAREVLLQLVFEYCFLKKESSETFALLSKEEKLTASDILFSKEIYEGVIKNFNALTDVIKANVKDFSFSQIFKVDYAILLIAIYEIQYMSTDKPIIINEALELAKKFSTDKSFSFINGILSSIIKG